MRINKSITGHRLTNHVGSRNENGSKAIVSAGGIVTARVAAAAVHPLPQSEDDRTLPRNAEPPLTERVKASGTRSPTKGPRPAAAPTAHMLSDRRLRVLGTSAVSRSPITATVRSPARNTTAQRYKKKQSWETMTTDFPRCLCHRLRSTAPV